MLKTLLFSCFLLLGSSSWAQDLAPQVLASTGGSATTSAGVQLSWTVGEPLSTTVSNSTNTLTQGFHQTNLLLSTLSEQAQAVKLNLFPNPTSQWLHLHSETTALWRWNLFTVHGRSLQTGSFQEQGRIDLSHYSSGLYLLRVQDTEGAYNSYKITVRH